MNTDAFFAIGATHVVCQDYATAGEGFVVLSDGCSSSAHTDFGARLLCRTAVLHGLDGAVAAAAPLLECLGLPTEALDATLLFARAEEGGVRVFVAGDGVVVARRRDGGEHYVFVSSFPSGAPFYLSYKLSPSRTARYLTEFGGEQVVGNSALRIAERHTAPPIVEVWLAAEEYDLVLLMSDGALSFRRPAVGGGSTAVPLDEVIAGMLALKGMAGQFMTRRAKRFLRDTTALGWYHDDDFSVAALHIGDTP